MKKIFAIIPVYHPPDSITILLDALRKEFDETPGIEGHIILINNGPPDQHISGGASPERINERENVGFAAACNTGIRKAIAAAADAVLLLNQDTAITPGFLAPLLACPASIAAPVIRFKRGSSWVYDHGGTYNSFWGKTSHYELPGIDTGFVSTHRVDYVSGCCMRIDAKAFETAGLFDPRYFLYFEDTDFCLRARKKGLSVAVVPKSVITHGLAEGRRKPIRQRLILIVSHLYFIQKWTSLFTRDFAYLYWLYASVRTLL